MSNENTSAELWVCTANKGVKQLMGNGTDAVSCHTIAVPNWTGLGDYPGPGSSPPVRRPDVKNKDPRVSATDKRATDQPTVDTTLGRFSA